MMMNKDHGIVLLTIIKESPVKAHLISKHTNRKQEFPLEIPI